MNNGRFQGNPELVQPGVRSESPPETRGLPRSQPCPQCGCAERPRIAHRWRLALVLLLWVVPLYFVVQIGWPVGIVPVSLVTVWVLMIRRKVCPQCGATR